MLEFLRFAATAFSISSLISSGSLMAQQLPQSLAPETAEYFRDKILPDLRVMTEELGIRAELQKTEAIEDIIAFGYETAIIRLNERLGAYSKPIQRQSMFNIWVICPLKRLGSLLTLPEKEESYVSRMRELRPIFVRGSYHQLMTRLAFKRVFWQLTPEMVNAYKQVPAVEQILDSKVLEELKGQRR